MHIERLAMRLSLPGRQGADAGTDVMTRIESRSFALTRSLIVTAALLTLALALAGCRSMAPKYVPPALPVTDSYGTAATSTTQPAYAIAWRDYFADPQLQSLIARALENNRDLRRAVLRVEQARAAYRIQRSEEFPTAGVGGIGTRGRAPEGGISGLALTPDQLTVGGGVSWEIDFWGRVRSLKDAALEDYLSSEASSRALGLSVITEVASSYVRMRELDERITLARRTLMNHEESLRIFTRRVSVGSTSRFDLRQVEVLRYESASLVEDLELARAQEANALDLLVGAPAGFQTVSAPLDENTMFGKLEPGLPSDVLTRRPDVVAAERALKARNANIGAARAAFFPRISLIGFFGFANPALSSLFDSDSRAWIVAPTVIETIFDAGRRRAKVELATLQREEAVAGYEHTVQAAFRDVMNALAALRWRDEQIGTLRATLDAQADRARLAKLSYDKGRVRYIDVLDAERGRLVAEQQLSQSRGQFLSAHVALYSALGGGAEDFMPPRPPTRNP
jgi:multidrug efflux system outer membrane protein